MHNFSTSHIASEKKKAKNKLSSSTCPSVFCAATAQKKKDGCIIIRENNTEKIEACAWEMMKILALLLIKLVTTGAFFHKSE